MSKGIPWTDAENQILIRTRPDFAAGKITLDELVQMLPERTVTAIRAQAKRLGLTKQFPRKKWRTTSPTENKWTPDEDKILIENAALPTELKQTANELTTRLSGRTVSAIHARTKKLGLTNKCRPTQNLKPGDKIHYLTLIEKLPNKNSHDGHVKWRCRCVCDKETIVAATALVSKTQPTLSCGCYKAKLSNDAAKHTKTGLIAGTNVIRIKNPNPNRNSTTGHKNISYAKRENAYVVQCDYKGKRYYLGCFKKLEQAIKARDEFKARLMPEIEALDATRQAQIPNLVAKFKADFQAEHTAQADA